MLLKLEQGLLALSLQTSSLQRSQLLEFVALLHKWNQAFNLTALREPAKMISRHLLDSLSVFPYLRGERLIDVGTGAGLPGLPLSIVCPERTFFLLDNNRKKQIFTSYVVKTLGLKNVQCICSKVERYQVEQKFSTILTRAFAPIEQMLSLTAHLLDVNGCYLAMIGKSVEKLPGYQIKQIVLQVPGETHSRQLAMIEPQEMA